MRFWRFWLLSFSCVFLLYPGVAAAQPMGAGPFLQSLGASPSATDLYDFMDIYEPDFSNCKELTAYLQALSLLAANGDTGVVGKRLDTLAQCRNMTPAEKGQYQTLVAQMPQRASDSLPVGANTPAATGGQGVNPAAGQSSQAPQTTPANPVNQANQGSLAGASSIAQGAVKPQAAQGEQLAATASKSTGLGKNTPKPARKTPAPAVRTPLSEKKVSSKKLQQRTHAAIRNADAQKVAVKASAGQAPVETTPQKAESNKPAFSVYSMNTWRSGDKGTSRLYKLENSITAEKGPWSLEATALYLNSGSYNGKSQVGSLPKGQRTKSPTTEATVFTPEVSYTNEDVTITVGTTPIGGEVDPLPTGKFAWRHEGLTLTAFQESVTDSLLSHIGFDDPYSGRSMGRVVKAGAKAAWTDNFAESWFYGGTVTGAYLYGHNVKGNNAVKAEGYVGKSFGQFSTGLYASFDHFTHNLNNYTMGHGGYYSPQAAAASALFASYTHTMDNISLSADISAGYLHEKTEQVDAYFKTSDTGAPYKGQSSNKLTINSSAEAILQLGSGFSLNTTARYLKAGDFHEGKGGVNMQFDF